MRSRPRPAGACEATNKLSRADDDHAPGDGVNTVVFLLRECESARVPLREDPVVNYCQILSICKEIYFSLFVCVCVLFANIL